MFVDDWNVTFGRWITIYVGAFAVDNQLNTSLSGLRVNSVNWTRKIQWNSKELFLNSIIELSHRMQSGGDFMLCEFFYSAKFCISAWIFYGSPVVKILPKWMLHNSIFWWNYSEEFHITQISGWWNSLYCRILLNQNSAMIFNGLIDTLMCSYQPFIS